MKRIVFYDGAATVPYSSASLDVPNLIGGTEATTARIAVTLGERHHVSVIQRARSDSEHSADGRVVWLPIGDGSDAIARADVIVVLRRIQDTLRIRRLNGEAPIILWYHDWYFPVRSERSVRIRLREQLKVETRVGLHRAMHVKAIGVSQTHAAHLRQHLDQALLLRPLAPGVTIGFVYNPIPDTLENAHGGFDPTKLVFFSAKWKGLDMVLRTFQRVRQAMPDMKLYVASPGYDAQAHNHSDAADRNVVFLGNLSPSAVLEEVRTALCVFYPADRVPESFGLVFAESHAVGTPVLAHPFGAACELLTPDELVDARNEAAIVDRVRAWRDGARPVVAARPELRLCRVGDAWNQLLFPD